MGLKPQTLNQKIQGRLTSSFTLLIAVQNKLGGNEAITGCFVGSAIFPLSGNLSQYKNRRGISNQVCSLKINSNN